MIAIISTCAEKLSEEEFVRPIKDIVKKHKFKVYNFKDVKKLEADKIIICGTALKDFEYLKFDWSWIKKVKVPILGICAGYQIIAKELGEELINKKLIGVFKGHYFLTSKLIKAKKVKELENLEGYTISFKERNFTAYAYHPEVYDKEKIINFL